MIEPAPGSLVVIQAHPDDADISSGATIAKWAAAGTEITYVTLTSGEAGSSKPELPPEQLGPLREREEEAAATELGVGEVVWLRYPDGRLQADEPVVHRLAAILAERRPAAVITHDPLSEQTGHPDHWNAGLATLRAVTSTRAAAERPGRILLFRSAEADTVVDVSGWIDVKLRAIEKHQSQRALGEAPNDAIVGWAESTGRQYGIAMAETFRSLTPAACDAMVEGELRGWEAATYQDKGGRPHPLWFHLVGLVHRMLVLQHRGREWRPGRGTGES